MKKHFILAAAVIGLAPAAPASAQLGGVIQQGIEGLLGGGGISSRLATLESQIRLSFERREISQSEAARLQDELVRLRQLEQSYRVDGLNRDERSDLQQRLRDLERRIQRARFDRDDRLDREDRFDRDDRFDDDDRLEDRRDGRKACPPGLAKKNKDCLPPGQAKKGQRFDRQFDDVSDREGMRDSDRFIYRQDGNRVLQIDRRTGQVVRIIQRRR